MTGPETAGRTAAAGVRWYYRCGDCLAVTAADSAEPLTSYRLPQPTCGACGGNLHCMGRVERNRLVRDELRVPCDDRCVFAPGPKCECKCGGENHGSQRVVAVVIDEGRAPRLTPVDVTAAVARATEYRAARDAARAVIERRYGALFQAKREGRWISAWGTYLRGCEFLARVRHAATYATHKRRLAELVVIAKEASV